MFSRAPRRGFWLAAVAFVVLLAAGITAVAAETKRNSRCQTHDKGPFLTSFEAEAVTQFPFVTTRNIQSAELARPIRQQCGSVVSPILSLLFVFCDVVTINQFRSVRLTLTALFA